MISPDLRPLVEEIIIDAFNEVEELDLTDPAAAEARWEWAERVAAETLGLNEMGVRELIAKSIKDPDEQAQYRSLYIENPPHPGELIWDHAERVLGSKEVEAIKANMQEYKARLILGA